MNRFFKSQLIAMLMALVATLTVEFLYHHDGISWGVFFLCWGIATIILYAIAGVWAGEKTPMWLSIVTLPVYSILLGLLDGYFFPLPVDDLGIGILFVMIHELNFVISLIALLVVRPLIIEYRRKHT